MSLNYGKYGILKTTGRVERLWEVLWIEEVISEMIKSPLLNNKREE